MSLVDTAVDRYQLCHGIKPMPSDPLLGLSVSFNSDPNRDKIDLGVGVYKDLSGAAPVFKSVKSAEQILWHRETTKAYIPPAGDSDFISAMESLLLGEDHQCLQDQRIKTLQTPGGSCALRIAAEFVWRCNPSATVWLSAPTWVNHQPLLGRIGLPVREYFYYDYQSHQLDFQRMMASLEATSAGDLILLQGCCHNPSGADLSLEQWQHIADFCRDRGLVPLVDIAYQGFAQGLAEDASGLRLLCDQLPEVLITASCSKNFALYRERVGSFSVVAATPKKADQALSQALDIIRGYYFVPAAHGAQVVKTILQDPRLRNCWLSELALVRERIAEVRNLLCSEFREFREIRGFQQPACRDRFAYISQQQGMFSFLGLSPLQVDQLRQQYSIYMATSSRINLSGINPGNINYLVNSVNLVLAAA
ncbi:Aspartate aminotransferase [Gammaproteobacteria bacterium MOLA455]|nr:Aspartate aminotransferase [Gammaproteobacteria bacterium MOLA455]